MKLPAGDSCDLLRDVPQEGVGAGLAVQGRWRGHGESEECHCSKKQGAAEDPIEQGVLPQPKMFLCLGRLPEAKSVFRKTLAAMG